MNPKKFLITGAKGFVAEYFIEYLNSNLPDAQILGLDVVPSLSSDYRNFKYVQLDLLNEPALKQAIEDFCPHYVIHLASISSVSRSWNEPIESFQNNTNIFLNLAEVIRELGLKTRVLSVGSSEEYGEYPQDLMPLKEEYELHPNNPYSVARVSQELLSHLYAKSYGVDIVMTRSFNHIGPRQSDTFVVSSFIRQLIEISKNPENKNLKVGNIEVIRDFLDVRDVIDAYYKILTGGRTGEVYNVCSGNGTKLKDIIDTVSKILNISPIIEIDRSKIRPTDSMVIIGDNSKLKNELGWQSKYSLENTLNDMINYFNKANQV